MESKDIKIEYNTVCLGSRYTAYISRLCIDLSTVGRQDLLDKDGKDVDKGNTNSVVAPHPDGSDKTVHLFEGHHLQQFIYSLTPKKRNVVSVRGDLEDKLPSITFLRDFSNTSQNSMEPETVEIFLSITAQFFNTSKFQFLLSFFEYCYSRSLPLRIFDGNKETLDKTLKEMKKYKIDFIKLQSEGKNDGEILQILENLDQESNQSSILNELIQSPIYEDTARKNKDDDVSLSPLDHTSLSFTGREDEINKLNEFLGSTPAFQMLFLIAPSGAGKTRLVTQWYREKAKIDGWQSGFVESEINEEGWKQWANEALTHDTLIIVDYIHRFKHVIQQITQKGAKHGQECSSTDELNFTGVHSAKKGKTSRLRLIILDHHLPDTLDFQALSPHQKEAFYKASLNSNYQHRHSPIQLGKLDTDTHHNLIKGIIAEISGRLADDLLVEKAFDTLERIDNQENGADSTRFASLPLFAILMGKALKDVSPDEVADNLAQWQRRDLIDFYFDESKAYRIPWKNNSEMGEWVGAAISAATACQTLPLAQVFKSLSGAKNSNQGKIEWTKANKDTLIADCQHIVPSTDAKNVYRYRPDIVGETFFLHFIAEFASVERVLSPFFEMICTQGHEDGELPIINDRVVEFVKRLTLNLSNDPYNDTTQSYWDGVCIFLNPKHYIDNASMQLTMSIATMAVINELRFKNKEVDTHDKYIIVNLIYLVDLDYLEENFKQQIVFDITESDFVDTIWWRCLEALITYMDWALESGELTGYLERKLESILAISSKSRWKKHFPVLCLLAYIRAPYVMATH